MRLRRVSSRLVPGRTARAMVDFGMAPSKLDEI
jgi:hypothetical protein